MIASEYGWTYEEFKKLTYRTLFIAVEMIGIRNHNEYAKQAALNGIKIEVKKIREEFEPITEKIKANLADVHQGAIERIVAEKRKKNKRS